MRRRTRQAEAAVRAVADTSLAALDRAVSTADDDPETRYRYAGPPADRAWCRDHLAGAARGVTYTMAEIRALPPGPGGLPPDLYAGGYNCRHRWVAVGSAGGGTGNSPKPPKPPAATATPAARTAASHAERRSAYDAFGPEWTRHAFDERTGGFVVVHDDHERGNLASELRVAEALMRQGRRVRLLSEKGPDGEPRIDADVDGERWDFKQLRATTTRGVAVNVLSAVQNQFGRASRQNAEGVGIDVQHPDAEPEALLAAARLKLARAKTRRLQTVLLVYPDGRVLTYRRDDISP